MFGERKAQAICSCSCMEKEETCLMMLSMPVRPIVACRSKVGSVSSLDMPAGILLMYGGT